MIHKWLDDLFDILIFLGLVFGLLLFFIHYWSNGYKTRQAEWIVLDFLETVSTEGRIEPEAYAGLMEQLARIDDEYEFQISCSTFELQPVYAKSSVEELERYYRNRNSRKRIVFKPYQPQLEEENIGTLRMQAESNASILAEEEEFLPLPREGTEMEICAVRSTQSVYEGEALITLCKIVSENEIYYMEAEPVCPFISGQIFLTLRISGEVHKVPVNVVCYPREVVCPRGHKVVNSRTVLEETKQTGQIPCPYCAATPEAIECNAGYLFKRTGEALNSGEIWAKVTYLDGHTEIITPETAEWQDDYDENFCGLQPVMIFYRGASTAVAVLSENNECLQCHGNCTGRNYEDYSSFPYCTKCMSEVILFTGNVQEEEVCMEKEELVALFDKSGEVLLNKGDYVSVILKKRGKYKSILQETVKKDGRSR